MNITITNRVTHDCVQGSDAWHALRAKHFTASEASAMLGVSKYQTRADLLKRKATGLSEEVDAATQRRFDDGHAAEAAARPIVEGIIDDDLYPITMTADVKGLPLLASMDGLTMLGDTGWETKLLNQDLRAAVEAGTLHEHYTVQMEQQLMVSGADRIYFTTTDGTPENTFGVWYESNPALRGRIVAGWAQFVEDLASYVPEPEVVKPVGKAPEAVPALRIEDAPRFGWRGNMLDSARHFHSVDQIKRVLDAMALHSRRCTLSGGRKHSGRPGGNRRAKSDCACCGAANSLIVPVKRLPLRGW